MISLPSRSKLSTNVIPAFSVIQIDAKFAVWTVAITRWNPSIQPWRKRMVMATAVRR